MRSCNKRWQEHSSNSTLGRILDALFFWCITTRKWEFISLPAVLINRMFVLLFSIFWVLRANDDQLYTLNLNEKGTHYVQSTYCLGNIDYWTGNSTAVVFASCLRSPSKEPCHYEQACPPPKTIFRSVPVQNSIFWFSDIASKRSKPTSWTSTQRNWNDARRICKEEGHLAKRRLFGIPLTMRSS